MTQARSRFAAARIRRHWSQRDVAEKLGTTVVTVSRWERGITEPSAYYRQLLCDLFDLSIEELGLIAEDPSSQTTTRSETFPPVESCAMPSSHGSLDARDAHLHPDQITPLIPHTSRLTPPLAPQAQNRLHMLRRLARSYHNLLMQSLQGMAWIELDLSEKPDAVQNATHLIFRASSQTERDFPAGTSILQVYDEAEQELLIVGAPGVGKSTLLLHLAQQLVIRAEQDETLPLPIILSLSSWAIKRPDVQDWIGEQLTTIYDVPQRVSEDWIRTEHILPLLDGLDEMDASARPDCIAAINEYHRTHLAPLVVCSRHEEYDLAAEHQRLLLHSAVQVRPLSPQQVETCISTLGSSQITLRHLLQGNAMLQELATTPLMLHIFLLTSQNLPEFDGVQHDQVQQQLWTAYLHHMVTYKGKEHDASLAQTRVWLGWLARQMRDHNMTVFYLEHLQPDWLPAGRERRWYERLATRGVGIVIGVIVSLFAVTLFSSVFPLPEKIWYGCIGGLIGGLMGGTDTCGLRLGQKSTIEPTEVLLWSGKRIGRSLLNKEHIRTSLSFFLLIFFFIGLSIGLNIGLSFGLVSWLLSIDLSFGLAYWGLAYWLFLGLWNGLSRERIEDHLRNYPNEGITRSVRSALLVGMLAGILCFFMSLLSTFLSSFFSPGQPYWLSTALMLGCMGTLLAALLAGGIASLRHVLLRLQLSRLGVIPWRPVRFLDDAASRVLLYKDGGGYRFIHRLFLDYCANLDTSETRGTKVT